MRRAQGGLGNASASVSFPSTPSLHKPLVAALLKPGDAPACCNVEDQTESEAEREGAHHHRFQQGRPYLCEVEMAKRRSDLERFNPVDCAAMQDKSSKLVCRAPD